MDKQIEYLEAAKYAVAQMLGKGSSGFAKTVPETHKLLFHVTWMDVFDYLDEQIEIKERCDIMEIDQIKKICDDHLCDKCPFYDLDYFECTIRMIPMEWNLEDIKRRYENYGKEKSSN